MQLCVHVLCTRQGTLTLSPVFIQPLHWPFLHVNFHVPDACSRPGSAFLPRPPGELCGHTAPPDRAALAPYPQLVAYGAAADNRPSVQAYSDWLAMFMAGSVLDVETCLKLHQCWLDSHVGRARWVTGGSLNQIRGVLWSREEKIPLASYERALDIFISSRGVYCPTPLPSDLARYVFPEIRFSRRDRQEKRHKRACQVHSRREERRRQEAENRYAALVGQAEIDLAFQTPESLRAWYLRWSQHELRAWDIERMLWSWLERCPSLSAFERWQYSGYPVWVLEAAASLTPGQKALECWVVPNKLSDGCRI